MQHYRKEWVWFFFLTYLLLVLCSVPLKSPATLILSSQLIVFPKLFLSVLASGWSFPQSVHHFETSLFLPLPALTFLISFILIFSILFIPIYSIHFLLSGNHFWSPVCSNQAISISGVMRSQKKACLKDTGLRRDYLVLVLVFISDLAWSSKKNPAFFLTWTTLNAMGRYCL